MRVELTFLIENRVSKSPYGVVGRHGLSVFLEVEDGFNILYDVGPSFDALLHNAYLLKKDIRKINTIVISHGHYDHANDLIQILRFIGEKEFPIVIHPLAFDRKASIRMNSTENDLSDMGVQLIKKDSPFMIREGIWFSGTIPRLEGNPIHPVRDDKGMVIDSVPDDTSLYIEGKEGLIVLSGCGHSGVINIIEHGKKVLGVEKVHALIGGFHGLGQPEESIRKTVDYLSREEIDVLAPCHCSGSLIYRLFEFKGFVDAKVGTHLSFELKI
ncbi:MAG: MBL fold metallo-hydrolase [Synergistetes bacterium]|nr:MBL fold metallo-hydrolase [Synergistota bacterium]